MNAAEFKEKILPVHQKLLRLSFRFLGNIQEAEDIVQEVFLKLWNMRDKLEDIKNYEAFSTTVTRNLCLDKLKARRTVRLDDQPILINREMSEDPQQISENQETMVIIREIVKNLPEQQQTVLIMRDIEQYEFEEIQNMTGMDMNYIRVNLSRARKQVREEISKIHAYGTHRNKTAPGEVL